MTTIMQCKPSKDVDVICRYLDKALSRLYTEEEIDSLEFGVDSDFECTYAWNIHNPISNRSFKLQFVKRTGGIFKINCK